MQYQNLLLINNADDVYQYDLRSSQYNGIIGSLSQSKN